ncbi:hypothetical protein ACWF94_35050 [Streptomyces sp. NPDC055078]
MAKALNSPYRAGGTWTWRKIRHSDTRDGALLGVFGPVERPRALLVRLPDDRTVQTSPRLTPTQSQQIGELVRGRLGELTDHPDHGLVRLLTEPLLVELRQAAGRQDTARFVRVRPEG